MLYRHPLYNKRQHDVTLDSYVSKIKLEGLAIGVRGLPWMVPGPVTEMGTQTYYLMSYATLAEALYKAHQESPHDPQVHASVAAGLPNCTVFKQDTPGKVLTYLKRKHNSFHGGAETSIVEALQEIPSVEDGWTNNLKEPKKKWDQFDKRGETRTSSAFTSG